MLIGYAALSFALSPNALGEIQLFPAGEFRSRDIRPVGIAGWKIDAAIAARVIARASARKTPFVIDYEHQTLNAEKNGQPAPASGWFQGAGLVWREPASIGANGPVEGGLYATGVAWTVKAKSYIEAQEYKFISPVFSYDMKSGEVLQIEMAALTNNPGLDGMDAVEALATSFFRSQEPTNRKDQDMKALAVLLGLPEDATEAEINAALVALKAEADTQKAEIAALKTETAALKTKSPDPAKYVPIETVAQLQTEVATLTARINDGELDDVIEDALNAGKLLPAMEGWARDLGKKDLAALKTYIATTPAIAALSGMQTGGRGPNGGADGDLSDTDLAVCKSMGIKPEDYKATLAEQAAA